MPDPINNNQQFLALVFGDDWPRAHVCSVPVLGQDDKYRAYWSGTSAGSCIHGLDLGWNNYFCVSLMNAPGVRRKANFESLHVIVVDDIGTKVEAGFARASLGTPTYRLETSPGNEHWGYVLETPIIGAAHAAANLIQRVITALVGPGGDDPGMAGVTRVMRLPFGSNTKYDPPFQCRLIEVTDFRLDAVKLNASLPGGMVASPVALPNNPPAVTPTQAPPGAVPGTVAKLPPPDPTLRAMRRLGMVLGAERKASQGTGWDVRCPWVHEHSPTSAIDTGTMYFRGGGFKCWHGHCDRRTPGDVRARINEILGEETGGLFSLDDFDPTKLDAVDPTRAPPSPLGGSAAAMVNNTLREFWEDTVYHASEDRFLSLKTDTVTYNDRALDTVWGDRLTGMTGYTKRGEPIPPSQFWRSHAGRGLTVDGRTWWPGRERIFIEDGARLINNWRDLEWPLEHLAAAELAVPALYEWRDLQNELLGAGKGDKEANDNADHWLDYQAMIVGDVGLKPGHNPMFIGPQGAGKELVLKPIRDVLGPDRHIGISETLLRDKHATWPMYRLVTMPEVARWHDNRRTDHDQYQKIKELCDPGKPFLSIRAVYQGTTQVRTAFVLVMTSNDDRPLALPPDDRRIWVVNVNKPAGWDIPRYQKLAWSLEQPFDTNRFPPEVTMSHAIVEWLARRWTAAVPGGIVSRLTGHAPFTRDKAALIRESKGELEAWVEELLERQPPDPLTVADVFTAADVMEKAENAAAVGGYGLARGTRLNGAHAIGRILARLGCKKLNAGQGVRIPGKPEQRFWCREHDAAIFTPMTQPELRDHVLALDARGAGVGV